MAPTIRARKLDWEVLAPPVKSAALGRPQGRRAAYAALARSVGILLTSSLRSARQVS